MNVLYVFLLCAGFAVAEFLIGGTRLLFGIPAYLILAVAAVVSVIDLRRGRSRPNVVCLAGTALFLGYVLVRGLATPYEYLASADEFMVLGGLAVYLLTACHVTDPQRRFALLVFLIVLGFVNVGVGVHQFATGDDHMLFGFLRSSRYAGRASGLYVCPDHMAFFLEVVGCLSLAWAFWSRSALWVRLICGYSAAVLFAGELLTGSRGGFLSASAGLGVLMILGLGRLRRTAPRRVIPAIAVAICILAIGFMCLRAAISRSDLLQSRARGLVTMQDVRPLLWKAGLAQFQLSPWFGTGASTYLYYGRRLRDPSVQDDPIRTHNDYLELLGEYGALGAAGLLLFLGTHAANGLVTYRRLGRQAAAVQFTGGSSASSTAAWNIGAMSAAAAMAAHSVVDFNLHIPANTLLAAFVFGTLANPGRGAAPSLDGRPAARWSDYLARFALIGVGVILFLGGIPRLPGEYYCERARVALRDGHFVAASGLALRGLETEKKNPQLYFYLGEARLSLAGNGPDTPLAHSFREGADEAYSSGLALAPCDTPLLLRHAEILTIFGEYEAAGETFEKALRWDPNSGLVQTYFGFFLEHCGRIEEARQAYTRAQQLSPNSAASNGLEQIRQLGIGAN